ncbi:MAG: SHD1 domain-containing protein [Thermoguttaceae bacterium]
MKKNLWLTIGAVVLTASLFGSVQFCSVQAQDRTWTSIKGHTVEATLLDYDGKEVKLRKKEDGKVVTVPVDQLSKADAIYLKQLDEPSGGDANPFAGGSDGDEKPSTKPSRTSATPSRNRDESSDESSDYKPVASERKPKKLSLRGAHTPAVGMIDGEWKVTSDAFDPPLFSAPTKAVSCNVGKLEFAHFPRQEQIFFSSPSVGKVFTTVTITNHKNQPPYTRGFVGDTKTGKAVSFPMAFIGVPLGISPNGTRIAIRREDTEGEGNNNWGKRGCIDVMEVVDGGKPQILESYRPFEEERPQRGIVGPLEVDVEEGDFIDDDHLFVRSAKGKLALFDVNDGSVVWTQNLEGGGTIVLTPGKKYALMSGGKRTLLVEMLTGDVVAELSDNDNGGSFAFSPTGTKFAKWNDNKISVWDFATGEKTTTLTQPGSGNLQWLSDEYILAGDDVIDLNLQCAIWAYSRRADNEKSYGGGLWCVFKNGDISTITPIKLPRPADVEAFRKIPESERFLVTTGTPVTLIIDSSVAQNRDKIEADLKKKLEGYGWKIEPNAAIQMRLSIKPEEERTVNYMGLGSAKYMPNTSSMTLEHQGKTVWSAQTTSGPPMMVSTSEVDKKGGLQEFARAMAAPRYDWFANVGIPDRIVNPAAKGKTNISSRGFE